MIRVIHLDDSPFELERVSEALLQNTLGYPFVVVSVSTVQAFHEALTENTPDVALLDIHLGEDEAGGAKLVDTIKRKTPGTAVIMCSADDGASTVAHCLRLGADDFLSKRTDRGELALRLRHSLELARLKRGLTASGHPLGSTSSAARVPIAGATMERVASRIPHLLKSAVSAVHVRGESGTGKEVVADLVHAELPSDVSFVRVNCGAIAPTLLESELFGHVRGSFTGASSDKKGFFEVASGGWIFLDEVASLSLPAQAALLRTLENQEVLRVGATQPVRISVRALSASNKSLAVLVSEGKFRGDLWQRLCETEIVLPPLRDRKEEIGPLVEHFCQAMPGGPYRVTVPLLDVLQRLDWRSGNIRELRNCMRSMTEFHVQGLLTPLAVPERIWQQLESDTEESPSLLSEPTQAALSQSRIEIQIDAGEPIVFEDLSDRLLLELTRKLAAKHGKLSLRRMSRMVSISRSTLSSRLRALVQKGLVELPDLSKWVGVTDSGIDEL